MMLLNKKDIKIAKLIVPHGLCVVGIVLFIFTIFYMPGIYRSLVSGTVAFELENGSDFIFMKFECRTDKKWQWKKPTNYTYDSMEFDFEGKNKVTIYFPSLICKYKNKEELFSKKLFECLLQDNSEDKVSSNFLGVDEFSDFIMSVKNGKLPPPRHHHYELNGSLMASYAHFSLGGTGYLIFLGPVLLFLGVIFQLISLFKGKKMTGILMALLVVVFFMHSVGH